MVGRPEVVRVDNPEMNDFPNQQMRRADRKTVPGNKRTFPEKRRRPQFGLLFPTLVKAEYPPWKAPI